ncbi:MAG: hypothetical protein HY000_33060 [Planctomycetes bacterium]|nr:hypothetical protein [Planctomycetota bacterium]
MDPQSRRQLLRSTAAGLLVFGGGRIPAQDRAPAERSTSDPRAAEVDTKWELDESAYIDYGRSFICNEYDDRNRPAADPDNQPMFWIESRTQVIHNGSKATYYQCASCKAENTYPDQDLFRSPNYDFLPIFGPDNVLIFRRGSRFNTPAGDYKRVELHKWGAPKAILRKPARVHVLDTAKKVFDATRPSAAQPIVARTRLRATDGYEAIIEYPVKTMNATDKGGTYKYQVDTGPIAWPNIWHGESRGQIASLSLAFIAFNNDADQPTFVEIVEEQPIEVALPEDPNRKVIVYHYERTPGSYRFAAETSLVAIE